MEPEPYEKLSLVSTISTFCEGASINALHDPTQARLQPHTHGAGLAVSPRDEKISTSATAAEEPLQLGADYHIVTL